MKILVITKSPWDDKLASGNTLSNFFTNWDSTQFACIYCRDALPSNSCCNSYLSISPIQVIKNLFTPWKIGRVFSTNTSFLQTDSLETKFVEKSKTNRSLYYLVNELIYFFCHWLNNRCKQYIQSFRPDVVFCFGVPDPVNCNVLNYIKKNTNAVIVSYFVDDLYNSHDKISILNRIDRKRLKEIVRISDKCYGISTLMCEEYSKIFKKEFSLLYKGCEINVVRTFINKPVRFVYAGNLLYNRSKCLVALANAIHHVNDGEKKAYLDIYTGTKISERVQTFLNLKDASHLNPVKPFSEIKKIMHDSDVVLHVESFDKEQMDLVRLSFSTKITDCMQSGSVLMAIGPEGIASIEYPKNNIPGTIVVNSLEKLTDIIKNIVDQPENLLLRAKMINDFAKKNVDIEQVRFRLKCEFKKLIDRKL